MTFALPTFPTASGRGRRPKAEQARYDAFVNDLADLMLEQYKQGTRWSTRGWCYALEESGLNKTDFDAAENIIVKLRKDGIIPLDAVLEDPAREWSGFENLDYADPTSEANWILSGILNSINCYRPISFWDRQSVFVCMAVEKRDLVSIFEPVCRQYHVPIANFRGSPDLLSRGKALKQFMNQWAVDRPVVVLYCGDHDPAGLRMSGPEMVSNFADMHNTILEGKRLIFNHGGFSVDRFGLNADFIKAAGLTWVDNLLTGQKDKHKIADLADPKHDHHNRPYVQNYIKQFGARKVEANALVVRPEMGRDLCRHAIEKYIDPESVSAFADELLPLREALRRETAKQLQTFNVEAAP